MPQKTRRVPEEAFLSTARIFRTVGGPLRYRILRMPEKRRALPALNASSDRKEKGIAQNMARNAAASKKITAAVPKTHRQTAPQLKGPPQSPTQHPQPPCHHNYTPNHQHPQSPTRPTQKKEVPTECYFNRDFRKAAAAYSPTWWGSTIGASELNFSVRYGKRWFLTAITAAVCYLREISWSEVLAYSKDLGLLVQVD